MTGIPLTFGIDGLDDLIHPGRKSSAPIAPGHAWTVAVQGPDGCGKSLLALHLASRYWMEASNERPVANGNEEGRPSVVYVSTDLSYDQASVQWKAFGLDQPLRRERVLRTWYGLQPARHESQTLRVELPEVILQQLDPVAAKDFEKQGESKTIDDLFAQLYNLSEEPPVWFVDLQSATAGDDWGWINSFVGLLPMRRREQRKHLLIIDAVEGLEMMVGERDAFGSRRSRRSRIAQLIRNATHKGMHIVFVVEEPRKDARLPEQFVTDLVIRTRHQFANDYSQRTIEIEKCRATPHVRGQHELSIRTGVGLFTGKKAHLDDPSIIWVNADESGTVLHPDQVTHLAHMHVTRSLDRRNREVRSERVGIPDSNGKPTFNLGELDNCFRVPTGLDPSTLSSVTLVLGEAGTHKARLGRAFLAGASFDGRVMLDDSAGIAILISSRTIDRQGLIEALFSHWPGSERDKYQSRMKETREAAEKENEALSELAKQAAVRSALDRFQSNYLRDKVFCQRLGSRRLSGAPLGEIIATYIHHAQQLMLGLDDIQQVRAVDMIESRRRVGPKIRLVIEDWNALLASHRELRDDPELLPSIITLLRREQINAIIISTQPAQPSIPVRLTAELPDLRSLDEPQIWTWPVMFYGQRRTAITVASGSHENDGSAIYELLPKQPNVPTDDGLSVDPHFDIYCDVEIGKPARVPLVVRLYAGNHPPEQTPDEPNRYSRLLDDALTQVFAAPNAELDVVQYDTYERYDRFFSFALELNTARLDHSLILQIDEFWSTEHKSFASLNYYWNEERVVHSEGEQSKSSLNAREMYYCHDDDTPPTIRAENCVRPKDAFYKDEALEHMSREEIITRGAAHPCGKGIDIPVPPISAYGSRTPEYKTASVRHQFFTNWWEERTGPPKGSDKPEIDRVPYLWDFGMLLAERELWHRYQTEPLPPPSSKLNSRHDWRVGDVWDALCLERSRFEHDAVSWRTWARYCRERLDWPTFLAACRVIGERERIPAFDVDLSTAESLTCVVLEMWASTQDRIAEDGNGLKWPVSDQPRDWSLKRLMERFPHSLFFALAQLLGTCTHLYSKHRVVTRRHESSRAASSREWYHTASAIMLKNPPETMTLLSLPGRWVTRGDWALAVVKGSRSKRLTYQALDVMTSRRMNLLRLQDGLGLPVRDILPDSQIGELPTAIYAANVHKKNPDVTPIDYKEVCFLGASDYIPFKWIWRSQIGHFDRDSFYFRRWIARLIEEREWIPNIEKELSIEKFVDAERRAAEVEEKSGSKKKFRAFDDPVFCEHPPDKFKEQFLSKLKIIAAAMRGV